MKETDAYKEKSIHRIIPAGETKCIWMTAGIVSFKLCSAQYDCTNCVFDRAMKAGSSGSRRIAPSTSPTIKVESPKREEVRPEGLKQLLDDFPPFHTSLDEDHYYHPKLTWVEMKDEKTARIGVDPFLLQLLEHVQIIVLPLIGNRIHQGEYFSWLFGEYSPLPMIAPIHGTVTAVNTQIREEPQLLTTRNDKDNWLVEITPDNFLRDKRTLLHGDTSKQWRENHIGLLRKYLHSALETESAHIGHTMNDGGIRLTHIADIVGRKKYYDIIFKFFRKS